MEAIEKALPFLTQFPRWLQMFFFAVLLQFLLLIFLGTVYAFQNAVKSKVPVIGATPSTDNTERELQTAPDAATVERPVPSPATLPDSRSSDASSKANQQTNVTANERVQAARSTSTPPSEAKTLRELFAGGAPDRRSDQRPLRNESERMPISQTLSASLAPQLKFDGKFPVVDVTVHNPAGTSELITAFTLVVTDYRPYASIPETKVLSPLIVVDVTLPFGEGSWMYRLNSPVLIVPNDAAMLAFRFSASYRGGPIPPGSTAGYTLKILLHTQAQTVVETEEFDL